MLLPINYVLRRGVVFRWSAYDNLADPALAGKTKPKFGIILSASHLDDPLLYILTTSEKPKHADWPFQADFLRIPAGTYDFLPIDTLVNVGEAGKLQIGRQAFVALYENGAVDYKGMLSTPDATSLIQMIISCPRVDRRFKRLLGA